MAQKNFMMHPRNKIAQPAIDVPDTKPEVNFQSGRFFILDTDSETRVATINHQFWRI